MSNDSADDADTNDIEAEEAVADESDPEEPSEKEESSRGAEEPADEEADGEASEDSVDANSAHAEEGFDYGDFVRLEYTARTVDEGNLVDTTDEEVAEDADVEVGDREFGPRTVVLGESHIFESVEEDIVGSEVGDTGMITVTSDEAFGEYDEEMVRTVSKDKIPEDDQYPGAQVTVDGDQGFVETIIGGRARVDFNHPLAGEDIEYDWDVIGTVDDREERAAGLIEMLLDLDLDVHIETDVVEEEQLVEDDEDEEQEGEDVAESGGEVADDEEADESEDEADSDGEVTESEDGPDEGEDEPEYETVEVEKESLYIEATPQLTMNQQWMMQKQQIAKQLRDLLDVDRVIVQEILDGGGLGNMLGGLGGLGGGGGGVEEALEEADIDEGDIDAEALADELE